MAEQRLESEHARELERQPARLQPAELEAIRLLAEHVPALWHASTITQKDRQAIARVVLHHVAARRRRQRARRGYVPLGGRPAHQPLAVATRRTPARPRRGTRRSAYLARTDGADELDQVTSMRAKATSPATRNINPAWSGIMETQPRTSSGPSVPTSCRAWSSSHTTRSPGALCEGAGNSSSEAQYGRLCGSGSPCDAAPSTSRVASSASLRPRARRRPSASMNPS